MRISIKGAFIIHAANFFMPEEIQLSSNEESMTTVEFTKTASDYILRRYEKGALISHQPYIDNKLDGHSKYWAKGVLAVDWNYKAGALDGISLGWNKNNGKQLYKNNWSEGKLDGVCLTWRTDGREAKSIYKKGVLVYDGSID